MTNMLLRAAADMGLAFAGEPDARVMAHLKPWRAELEPKLAAEFGADVAAAIVDQVIKVMLERKHYLERLGVVGSPLMRDLISGTGLLASASE